MKGSLKALTESMVSKHNILELANNQSIALKKNKCRTTESRQFAFLQLCQVGTDSACITCTYNLVRGAEKRTFFSGLRDSTACMFTCRTICVYVITL